MPRKFKKNQGHQGGKNSPSGPGPGSRTGNVHKNVQSNVQQGVVGVGQSRDRDSAFQYLEEMFRETLDADVIHMVLVECDWKVDMALESLITLSGGAATQQREETATSTLSGIAASLVPSSASGVTEESSIPTPASRITEQPSVTSDNENVQFRAESRKSEEDNFGICDELMLEQVDQIQCPADAVPAAASGRHKNSDATDEVYDSSDLMSESGSVLSLTSGTSHRRVAPDLMLSTAPMHTFPASDSIPDLGAGANKPEQYDRPDFAKAFEVASAYEKFAMASNYYLHDFGEIDAAPDFTRNELSKRDHDFSSPDLNSSPDVSDATRKNDIHHSKNPSSLSFETHHKTSASSADSSPTIDLSSVEVATDKSQSHVTSTHDKKRNIFDNFIPETFSTAPDLSSVFDFKKSSSASPSITETIDDYIERKEEVDNSQISEIKTVSPCDSTTLGVGLLENTISKPVLSVNSEDNACAAVDIDLKSSVSAEPLSLIGAKDVSDAVAVVSCDENCDMVAEREVGSRNSSDSDKGRSPTDIDKGIAPSDKGKSPTKSDDPDRAGENENGRAELQGNEAAGSIGCLDSEAHGSDSADIKTEASALRTDGPAAEVALALPDAVSGEGSVEKRSPGCDPNVDDLFADVLGAAAAAEEEARKVEDSGGKISHAYAYSSTGTSSSKEVSPEPSITAGRKVRKKKKRSDGSLHPEPVYSGSEDEDLFRGGLCHRMKSRIAPESEAQDLNSAREKQDVSENMPSEVEALCQRMLGFRNVLKNQLSEKEPSSNDQTVDLLKTFDIDETSELKMLSQSDSDTSDSSHKKTWPDLLDLPSKPIATISADLASRIPELEIIDYNLETIDESAEFCEDFDKFGAGGYEKGTIRRCITLDKIEMPPRVSRMAELVAREEDLSDHQDSPSSEQKIDLAQSSKDEPCSNVSDTVCSSPEGENFSDHQDSLPSEPKIDLAEPCFQSSKVESCLNVSVCSSPEDTSTKAVEITPEVEKTADLVSQEDDSFVQVSPPVEPKVDLVEPCFQSSKVESRLNVNDNVCSSPEEAPAKTVEITPKVEKTADLVAQDEDSFDQVSQPSGPKIDMDEPCFQSSKVESCLNVNENVCSSAKDASAKTVEITPKVDKTADLVSQEEDSFDHQVSPPVEPKVDLAEPCFQSSKVESCLNVSDGVCSSPEDTSAKAVEVTPKVDKTADLVSQEEDSFDNDVSPPSEPKVDLAEPCFLSSKVKSCLNVSDNVCSSPEEASAKTFEITPKVEKTADLVAQEEDSFDQVSRPSGPKIDLDEPCFQSPKDEPCLNVSDMVCSIVEDASAKTVDTLEKNGEIEGFGKEIELNLPSSEFELDTQALSNISDDSAGVKTETKETEFASEKLQTESMANEIKILLGIGSEASESKENISQDSLSPGDISVENTNDDPGTVIKKMLGIETNSEANSSFGSDILSKSPAEHLPEQASRENFDEGASGVVRKLLGIETPEDQEVGENVGIDEEDVSADSVRRSESKLSVDAPEFVPMTSPPPSILSPPPRIVSPCPHIFCPPPAYSVPGPVYPPMPPGQFNPRYVVPPQYTMPKMLPDRPVPVSYAPPLSHPFYPSPTYPPMPCGQPAFQPGVYYHGSQTTPVQMHGRGKNMRGGRRSPFNKLAANFNQVHYNPQPMPSPGFPYSSPQVYPRPPPVSHQHHQRENPPRPSSTHSLREQNSLDIVYPPRPSASSTHARKEQKSPDIVYPLTGLLSSKSETLIHNDQLPSAENVRENIVPEVSRSEHAIPMTFASMAAKSRHARPKQRVATNEKSTSPPTSTNAFEIVRQHLEAGDKVLIIMRGCPGSGKSTLARQLKFNGVILTTDDYFLTEAGEYQYEQGKIGDAHEWNHQRAAASLQDGVNPVIIDNTNAQTWEMKPYVMKALEFDYKVEIFEPNTPWQFKAGELARRNSHGVSKESIIRMIDRFERNVTVDKVIHSSDKLRKRAEQRRQTQNQKTTEKKPEPRRRRKKPEPRKTAAPKPRTNVSNRFALLEDSSEDGASEDEVFAEAAVAVQSTVESVHVDDEKVSSDSDADDFSPDVVVESDGELSTEDWDKTGGSTSPDSDGERSKEQTLKIFDKPSVEITGRHEISDETNSSKVRDSDSSEEFESAESDIEGVDAHICESLPTSLDRQPISLERQPVSLERQPVSLERQPVSLERQPVSLERQPVSLERQPVSLERQPVSLDMQPASLEMQDTKIGKSCKVKHSEYFGTSATDSVSQPRDCAENMPQVCDAKVGNTEILSAGKDVSEDAATDEAQGPKSSQHVEAADADCNKSHKVEVRDEVSATAERETASLCSEPEHGGIGNRSLPDQSGSKMSWASWGSPKKLDRQKRGDVRMAKDDWDHGNDSYFWVDGSKPARSSARIGNADRAVKIGVDSAKTGAGSTGGAEPNFADPVVSKLCSDNIEVLPPQTSPSKTLDDIEIKNDSKRHDLWISGSVWEEPKCRRERRPRHNRDSGAKPLERANSSSLSDDCSENNPAVAHTELEKTSQSSGEKTVLREKGEITEIPHEKGEITEIPHEKGEITEIPHEEKDEITEIPHEKGEITESPHERSEVEVPSLEVEELEKSLYEECLSQFPNDNAEDDDVSSCSQDKGDRTDQVLGNDVDLDPVDVKLGPSVDLERKDGQEFCDDIVEASVDCESSQNKAQRKAKAGREEVFCSAEDATELDAHEVSEVHIHSTVGVVEANEVCIVQKGNSDLLRQTEGVPSQNGEEEISETVEGATKIDAPESKTLSGDADAVETSEVDNVEEKSGQVGQTEGFVELESAEMFETGEVKSGRTECLNSISKGDLKAAEFQEKQTDGSRGEGSTNGAKTELTDDEGVYKTELAEACSAEVNAVEVISGPQPELAEVCSGKVDAEVTPDLKAEVVSSDGDNAESKGSVGAGEGSVSEVGRCFGKTETVGRFGDVDDEVGRGASAGSGTEAETEEGRAKTEEIEPCVPMTAECTDAAQKVESLATCTEGHDFADKVESSATEGRDVQIEEGKIGACEGSVEMSSGAVELLEDGEADVKMNSSCNDGFDSFSAGDSSYEMAREYNSSFGVFGEDLKDELKDIEKAAPVIENRILPLQELCKTVIGSRTQGAVSEKAKSPSRSPKKSKSKYSEKLQFVAGIKDELVAIRRTLPLNWDLPTFPESSSSDGPFLEFARDDSAIVERKEMKDAGTCTTSYDFVLLYKAQKSLPINDDSLIIIDSRHGKDLAAAKGHESGFSSAPGSPRKRSKFLLDKSCNTEEILGSTDDDLKFLRSCFPTVQEEDLIEILGYCVEDVQWAVNLLLDAGCEYNLPRSGDNTKSLDVTQSSVEEEEDKKCEASAGISGEVHPALVSEADHFTPQSAWLTSSWGSLGGYNLSMPHHFDVADLPFEQGSLPSPKLLRRSPKTSGSDLDAIDNVEITCQPNYYGLIPDDNSNEEFAKIGTVDPGNLDMQPLLVSTPKTETSPNKYQKIVETVTNLGPAPGIKKLKGAYEYGRPFGETSLNDLSGANERIVSNVTAQETMDEATSEEKEDWSSEDCGHILQLSPALAVSLQEMFGPVGFHVNAGSMCPDDLTVDLSYNLARLLHQAWAKSLDQKLKNEEHAIDQMLKADEELAKQLQSEEDAMHHVTKVITLPRKHSKLGKSSPKVGNSPKLGNSPLEGRSPSARRKYSDAPSSGVLHREELRPIVNASPPVKSLKDIMNEEMAFGRKSDAEAKKVCQSPTSGTMASRLKRQKLYEMFPGLQESVLDEIFDSCGCALGTTVTAIRGSVEDSSVFTPQNLEDYEEILVREAEVESMKEKYQQQQKETFQEFQDPDYHDYRAEATLHYRLRHECFQKAQDAHRRGMKQVATFYSQQGHTHTEKIKAANRRASDRILSKRTHQIQQSNTLDLHGLHVSEAIEALEDTITSRQQEIMERPEKKKIHLYVVTGRGNRSRGGVARIKPAVIDYLSRKGYRYTEPQLGMLRVNVNQVAQ